MASSNPFEELSALLEEMKARADNPDHFLDGLGQVMLRETRQSISQRQSPSGEAWRPVSLATQGIGRRNSQGLRNSFSIAREGDTLNLASAAPYAMAQNFGNPNNRLFGGKVKPIPARPFSPVSDSEVSPAMQRTINRIFAYIFEGQE